MRYEAFKDQELASAWRVEAINFDGDGEGYVTVFFEPKAEERAREYAALKNG